MRIRNGAEYLEAAIESHVGCFDEIVAVYNQCSDATPRILERLAARHPRKLRVVEYLPQVYPPGSKGHKETPPDSVHSLVNYYNYALSQSTRRFATKLDDDHIAFPEALANAVRPLANGRAQNCLFGYSGLNLLAHPSTGEIGVCSNRPFAGNGDLFIFPVSPDTYFVHSELFEEFRHRCSRRRYLGLIFYHLKYLKENFGWNNYEVDKDRMPAVMKRLAASLHFCPLSDFIARCRSTPCFIPGSSEEKRYRHYPLSLLRLLSRLPVRQNLALARATRLSADLHAAPAPNELLDRFQRRAA